MECCNPNASKEKCVVCGSDVFTCERLEPVDNNYCCPVHPDGIQSFEGLWFCGNDCYDKHFVN